MATKSFCNSKILKYILALYSRAIQRAMLGTIADFVGVFAFSRSECTIFKISSLQKRSAWNSYVFRYFIVLKPLKKYKIFLMLKKWV